MLREKTVWAGTTWELKETKELYRLTIEEGGAITAPKGKFVNFSLDGIGKQIKPGHYEGVIILTVAEEYHMDPHGLMRETNVSKEFRNAIVIADGKIVEEKGVVALVNGGDVTGNKAEEIYIGSEEEGFNGILITGDTKYEIKDSQIDFEGFAENDFMGVGAAVTTIDKAEVEINDTEINVNGVTRCTVHVGGDSKVTLNNCTLSNYSEDSDWLGSFSWAVGFRGTNRLAQLTDNAIVHYNNCHMKSNGWGVLSIDGSDDGVKMYVKDSYMELFGPRSMGYGAFCIGDNSVSFSNTKVKVNGFPMLLMGMEGKGYAEIVEGCVIEGRRFGAMVIDDDNSIFNISDSAFKTEKSTLVIKGSSTKINVNNTTMEPKNGTLVQLMDDDQTAMNFSDFKIPVGVVDTYEDGRDLTTASETEDVVLNVSNSTLEGNIFNSTTNIRAYKNSTRSDMGRFHDSVVGMLSFFEEDMPEGMMNPVEARHNGDDLKGAKNLGLNLENVKITGMISSATQKYRDGLNLITERNRDELGNILQTAAPTVNNGVVIIMDKDSVWTLTKTCYVTALNLVQGAKVQTVDGKTLTMTVNGVKMPIAAGEYSGKIALTVE